MTINLRKQTLFNTIGNVTYLGAQWVLTVLTTHFLGYEAVGNLTLAMSVGNVFTFIQMYGTRSFQSSDVTNQYNSGDYFCCRLITTGIGLLLCLLFLLISNYDNSLALSIFLFTLFRTFEAISDVFFGDIQRAGKLELVGMSMFIRGILTVILFMYGLKIFQSLNTALFFLVIGSFSLTLCLDFVLYIKTVNWIAGTKNSCLSLLKVCFPLLLAVLLPSIISAFPRVLLERYSGTETLGYYGNISTPAVIITALVPNIIASLMPLYGKMAIQKDYSGLRYLWLKTILGTFVFLVICIIGVAFFGKPVLTWLYTDTIRPYIHFLYYLLLSTTLYAMTMCNGSALIALRKNREVSLCAIFATVICIVLSIPLVQFYKIRGAITILIVSYFSQVLLQTIIILKSTCK